MGSAYYDRKMSTEERERRSTQAKRLNAEGKFGGKQRGSGRPSKLRTKLSKEVAELIAGMSEAQLIVALELLKSILHMVKRAEEMP